MADITEQSQFTPTVTAAVKGMKIGASFTNSQIGSLANRTRWLLDNTVQRDINNNVSVPGRITCNEVIVSTNVSAGGVISAVDFNSTSDERLKTNVRPIDGLASVNKIKPVQFDWIKGGETSYGAMAQEVEKVFPELVVQREDGYKGVNYIPMIAMLIKAVQELEEQVKELQSRV